ncbi:polysaccharide biosynthesis tyrosine autokinase [Novosphingobium profundi]|uniref:GumC family protein n=1 Tax=Novosphingobium profundi TaxID=1774954 RepID=UPI001BD91950|nr:polysaccharide biosynthesis tyrosine autokinase [Novosphingobium profundi]MBT0668695.1 polysaccharide biosynthesis tyrosine autokinase [Novosphingobium profundi]
MNNSLVVHRGSALEAQWAQAFPALASPPEDRIDLRSIYFALRRQLSVILAIAGLFVLLAIAFTALQHPQYKASSRVVLNTAEDRGSPRREANPSAPPDSDQVDTEVEVIRSNELALSVARTLGLDTNPNFAGTSGAGLRQRLMALVGLGGDGPAPVRTREEVLRAIANRLQDELSVERIGTTHAFNISVTAPDARDAQAIANEYARQYSQFYLVQKRASGAQAAKFLSGRLEELRQQAMADTARVQQYRIANNLLSTTGASLSEQEISSYNQEVASARAEAAADRAQLSTARAQLRNGSAGDDVGEALDSPVVSSLRSKRAEVAGRVASLESQFGPGYPSLQSARSELDTIDAQIASEIKRIISNLEAKVEVSSGRLGSLQGSLGSAKGQLASNNRAMVALDDLSRRAEASQQLYDSYLAEYKQTVASQGTERPDARVISYAELPRSPFAPRPVLNLALALVVGLGVGVVVGLIREMLYTGLSTSADVEHKLGIRCLESVPQVASILPGQRNPIEAVYAAPMSGYVEAFRGLRAAINHALGSTRNVIMITSALPREGKTTICACLARVAALGGESAVVVDVDVRQRGASRLLDSVRPGVGLLEVLRGEASLEDALVRDEYSGAYVLPIVGDASGLEDLMNGGEIAALLARLGERFNLVLLDAPPILPITYTRTLASQVDGVVVVAKWRATADHAVRAALRLLPEGRVRLAGAVLSQVDIRKQAKFGYGDPGFYYEYYRKYYA